MTDITELSETTGNAQESFLGWNQDGEIYSPTSTSTFTTLLQPGIYTPGLTSRGWFLTRTGNSFDLPFRVYGWGKSKMERIIDAWNHQGQGNFGFLLNGIRGAGKTVTLQLICNHFIEQGLPIIRIDQPFAGSFVSKVLQGIQQDCVVVFDEFEKQYHDPQLQQSLLTVVDGLDRSRYRRMFCFTTNATKIDENFLDRPGRIRYVFTFDNLDETTVYEMITDLLDPKYIGFADDIAAHCLTRKVISVDVVRAIINEVNSFASAPETFEEFFNAQPGSEMNLQITQHSGDKTSRILVPNTSLDADNISSLVVSPRKMIATLDEIRAGIHYSGTWTHRKLKGVLLRYSVSKPYPDSDFPHSGLLITRCVDHHKKIFEAYPFVECGETPWYPAYEAFTSFVEDLPEGDDLSEKYCFLHLSRNSLLFGNQVNSTELDKILRLLQPYKGFSKTMKRSTAEKLAPLMQLIHENSECMPKHCKIEPILVSFKNVPKVSYSYTPGENSAIGRDPAF